MPRGARAWFPAVSPRVASIRRGIHRPLPSYGSILVRHSRTLQQEGYPDGFRYIPNFVDQYESNQLKEFLSEQDWKLGALSRTRRICLFGHGCEYVDGQITQQWAMKEGLPLPLKSLARRFVDEDLCQVEPQQVLACEYMVGQSVGHHIDRVDLFGDTVLALSLGREEYLTLKYQEKVFKILLEPNSLYVLSRDARYKWTHGIRSKKKKKSKGKCEETATLKMAGETHCTLSQHDESFESPEVDDHPRGTLRDAARYALTFRTVIEKSIQH